MGLSDGESFTRLSKANVTARRAGRGVEDTTE